MRAVPTTLAALVVAAAPPARSAETAAVPSFVLLQPPGLAAPTLALPALPGAGWGGPAGATPAERAEPADRRAGDASAEEGAVPPRPGTFRLGATELPTNQILRRRAVTERLTPDVELATIGATTIGLFGEVRRADPRTTAPVRVLNRDLGAGLTLEYRFGR